MELSIPAIDEIDERADSRDPQESWVGFQEAIKVLRSRIRGNGASDLVIADLFEDDLRQSRIALAEVQSYLDQVVETLSDPGASPSDLIAASDTSEAFAQAEKLLQLLPALRRRLGQAALKLSRG
jgi:hypothetical protein